MEPRSPVFEGALAVHGLDLPPARRLPARRPAAARARLGVVGALLAGLCVSAPFQLAQAQPANGGGWIEEDGVAPGPRIRMEEVTLRWSRMLQGTQLTKNWVVHNDGDQPLEIREIKTKCNCSTFEAPPPIPPGESGIIVLHFDSNKIHPNDTDKSGEIFTNDPLHPVTQIWYGGPVVKAFRHIPARVALEGLITEQPEITVDVMPATEIGFVVTEAKAAYDFVEVVQVEPLSSPPRATRLTLRKLPGTEAGQKQEFIKLTLTLEDGLVITPFLQLDVIHRNRVVVHPESNLTFNSKETNRLREDPPQPVTKIVEVRAARDGITFELLEARIEDAPEGAYHVEVDTVLERHHYRVKVTIREHPGKSYTEGKLIIVTDDPAAPRQELKLFAKFARKAG